MEVTGVVFRQAPFLGSTAADGSNSRGSHSFSTVRKPNSFRTNRRSFAGCGIADEFADKGHLQYYNGPRMAMKEKEVKKKMKLLKGLSKKLDTFSEMGFCLKLDDGLDQQVKGQMISEATEVLLAQLQKLEEEKMESKRMKKEEKAKKKASRMMMMMKKTDCKDPSSSSESSSSESDCDNNVVNMSQQKTIAAPNTHQDVATPPIQVLEKVENKVTETASCKFGSNVNEGGCGKKIEVCMGGKCKKSGAAMLLENFEKAVAGEVEVVGRKCMGKCRDGPNVKARDEVEVTSSLCIGVGLEDVDSIVTSFVGGSRRLGSDKMPASSSV